MCVCVCGVHVCMRVCVCEEVCLEMYNVLHESRLGNFHVKNHSRKNFLVVLNSHSFINLLNFF